MSATPLAPLTLALVGNPNVGKSVVFQSLTGIYAEVSNYPGTTVDITTGTFDSYFIIDTPGVFSLSGYNDEEQVTLSAIADCDFILNVLDGTHLSRDLFLTLQLIALGKPLMIAINLMDQVEKKRLSIDLAGLSQTLGVAIFPISAKKNKGISPLKTAILRGNWNPAKPTFPLFAFSQSEENDLSLRKNVDQLTSRFIGQRHKKTGLSEHLGRFLLRPLIGFPFLAGILSLIFLFIGKFLSQTVVNFTEGVLMEDYYFHFIYGFIADFLDPDRFLGVLLIGEYGLLTMVPIYLFGLLFPLVIGFYLILALLEDSGLLPRIAVLCDRLFLRFGLNGKAIIPVLLGFGCITMALITTRILGTKRERLIASVLLCIAVPCSAQFSIIMVVAATLPPFYFFLYCGAIFSIFCAIGILLDRFLPGISSDLFLVLPPLRLPGLKNIMKKTAMKSKHFLHDAGPMFLIGSILISLLSYYNGFITIHEFLLPLTQGFLGLPAETATLFLMSVIKRDLGAAYLYSMVSQGLLSFSQITVTLTVVTLFVPCFASLAILFKERGPFTASLIWIGSLFTAFLAGGILAWVFQF